ncbi:Rne/Rng family ribonuclease [Jiangella gansuensis]|uniref:Rne/Rng family ribonuclease n=1 Tax=Jiangella gansuensis TaxID=281473 RepID=UPI0004BB26D4|nr:Rne/Rng family ribonuclease [Jiangella gansuensis]
MQEDNTGSSGDIGSSENAPAGTDTPQPRRRRAASRAAGPPVGADTLDGTDTASTGPDASSATGPDGSGEAADAPAPAKRPARKTAAKKTTAKKTAKKPAARKSAAATAQAEISEVDETAAATPPAVETATEPAVEQPTGDAAAAAEPAEKPAEKPAKAPRKRASRSRKAAQSASDQLSVDATASGPDAEVGTATSAGTDPAADVPAEQSAAFAPTGDESAFVEERASAGVLFQPPSFDATPLFAAPDPEAAQPVKPRRSRRTAVAEAEPEVEEKQPDEAESPAAESDEPDDDTDGDGDGDATRRRRRRRGGRGRRRKSDDGPDSGDDAESDSDESQDSDDDSGSEDAQDSDDGDESGTRRRRRRRRRRSEDGEDTRPDDPPNTVVRVRETRELDDEVTSVKGSTRLEAKKQRRREGREAGRRRPPILSEAEFLARREAVDRVMAVRQSGDLTQIAVLEDSVLVEHYVSQASQQSLIGNVYLGRVQNVLPAMEAAFIDIGRGRNAVLYAGEVDWTGPGRNDGPKRIEDVLKSGQPVLVQVTKDPIGHKGARLTSQVSLPGRYVVYVPGGSMNGISRKLPDTERTRLKKILKQVVPEDAGVIVRTAAEGASEEELTNDVARLKAEWEALQKKSAGGNAPQLLHGEPDLAIKVVRDLFNEDFTKLVVSGDRVWDTIDEYVTSVAGSLRDRVEKWTGPDDVFAAYRIDEQIAKAMDRKVWLPSGGSLVIDRTEAMTVVDVNTGKFTGSGGNLEETVTKNNLEAAEEIVRQLRLRDIGGIIVIDFIDMVLEANRDLVLRRLVECLGRDRTKHQVAEVTSLGLVQMTRKRIGTGLLEAFSEPCPHCKGRGLLVHTHPVESGSGGGSNGSSGSDDTRGGRSERRGRRRKNEQPPVEKPAEPLTPKLEALASPGEASPADLMPVAANGTSDEGDERAAATPPPPPPPPQPAETLATGPGAVEAAATGQAPAGQTAAGQGAADDAPASERQPEKKPRRRSSRRSSGPAAEAAPAEPLTPSAGESAAPARSTESPGSGAAEIATDGAGAATTVGTASVSSGAASEPVSSDSEPARPRRTRRRAQRPAGSPDEPVSVP